MANIYSPSQVHASRLNRLLRAEEGMLSAIQLVTVTFFSVMILYALSVINVLGQKIELQNAADASARAAATWLARGMNALCATNHLIGETTAMLIVHDAIAGPVEDDQDDEAENSSISLANDQLRDAYQRLVEKGKSAPADDTAYQSVHELVTDQATVRRAKLVLKLELTKLFDSKEKSAAPTLSELSEFDKCEREIVSEYEILSNLAILARSARVMQARNQLEDETLRDLRNYAETLSDKVPELAQLAAAQVAIDNGVAMELYPQADTSPRKQDSPQRTALRMPIQVDPLAEQFDLSAIPENWYGPRKPKTYYDAPPHVPIVAIDWKQITKVTQLCRATFPWVNYHRDLILKYLVENCPISKAGDLYFEESTGLTASYCYQLQKEKNIRLYVMERATLPDKGFENWTDDPHEVDAMFTVVCIARPKPNAIKDNLYSAKFAYQQSATARAIVYNGNPQQAHPMRIDLHIKRIVPEQQSATGWDTLQWVKDSDGNMPFELIGKGKLLAPNFPCVRVAWEAKLVPMTPGMLATTVKNTKTGSLSDLANIPEEIMFLRQNSLLTTH